jgi:hypothetical protein
MYTPAFFDLQLRFAKTLVARVNLSLADVLHNHTTFTKSLHIAHADDWAVFMAGFDGATNKLNWTYQWYMTRHSDTPALTPDATTYYDHPLFGCFYFIVRDTTIIRPHFVNNDLPGARPLSRARKDARHAELRRMFGYIKQHVPHATTVLGNSWLYNLHAYRRLYPSAYMSAMAVSTKDEFQFLALWGQCFDHRWQVKEIVAHELLRRVEMLTDLSQLRWCFPYQILQPVCSIDTFFYILRHSIAARADDACIPDRWLALLCSALHHVCRRHASFFVHKAVFMSRSFNGWSVGNGWRILAISSTTP